MGAVVDRAAGALAGCPLGEYPLAPEPSEAARCHLSASTIQRWLDQAGQSAEGSLRGQWVEVATRGVVGLDGLWARLRRGVRGVVLLLVESGSGFCWPPMVVEREAAAGWQALVRRAEQAGLALAAVRGVVSDGGNGIVEALEATLDWVNHQRCVFHLWRGLAGDLAAAAEQEAAGLHGAAATAVKRRVKRTLRPAVRAVFDAPTPEAAEAALVPLRQLPGGEALARRLAPDLDAALVVRNPYNPGLARITPETSWRDFRRRLSRGRNHGSAQRLERAALLWHVYHNAEPSQARCERTRSYRHPSHSPLAAAGVALEGLTYLDLLAV